MKSNTPHKRVIPPDKGWNIRESKHSIMWGRRKTYGGKNIKVYWLNVFNRKLRRFFKKEIKNAVGKN